MVNIYGWIRENSGDSRIHSDLSQILFAALLESISFSSCAEIRYIAKPNWRFPQVVNDLINDGVNFRTSGARITRITMKQQLMSSAPSCFLPDAIVREKHIFPRNSRKIPIGTNLGPILQSIRERKDKHSHLLWVYECPRH